MRCTYRGPFAVVTLLLLGICGAVASEVDDNIPPPINDNTVVDTTKQHHNQNVAESRLTAQILAIMKHFQQDDPVGLPGAPIPDPFPVPDVKKSIGMGTLTMKKTLAYGMSKFRLKTIKSDLNALAVNASILLDEMTVHGNYTLRSLFSSAEGPFTVVLKQVFVQGNASLGVERDGRLRTQDIRMDISFADMAMDFQNLGFMGSVFQSFVNSAPTLVFDSIKPFMLKEAYEKIRSEIDQTIDKLAAGHSLPNSITPLDMAIAEARKRVRAMGFDPYRVADYNRTAGVFSVEMSGTWVSGLSSFYRVGEVAVAVENNTVAVVLQLGTQQLEGSSQWQVSVASGMITRVGHVQFTVQHVKVEVEVSQALDTRKRPQMRDLQLELGNIQVRCDGAGTLDYVTEFVVNVLPNLLRYQIMDAIEAPVRNRIQEMFNHIELLEITTALITDLSNCRTKIEQFKAISNIAIKFVYRANDP